MKESQITHTHALCFSVARLEDSVRAGLTGGSSSTLVLVRNSRAFPRVSFLLISAQRDGISTPLITIGELLSPTRVELSIS